MFKMKLLPHWCLTDARPAFYDTESATAIGQTAKLYGAMNKLIESYNAWIDEVNKTITEFNNETDQDIECFKRAITELCNNYIATMDMKIEHQDRQIEETIVYMKENIYVTVKTIIDEMKESGELDEAILSSFESVNQKVNELETLLTSEVEKIFLLQQDNITNKQDIETNKVNIEALKDKVNTLYFDNVAAMKNSTKLNSGDTVQTLGYYEVNDGGAAIYKIRDHKATDVEDGSIHLLNKGLVAELIIENEINVKQFGAKGDGINDESLSFNNLISFIKNKNISIYIPNGEYLISNSIILDSNIRIIGENKFLTKIKQDEINLDNPIIKTDFSDNHQIENITIENISIVSNGERTSYPIQILNANSTTFRNCYIGQEGTSESFYHGILIDKNSGFTGSNFLTKIIDCRFSQSKLKINSTDSYILHNELWGNNLDCALHIVNASSTSITNNEIVGGKTYGGIYITDSNEGLKITSNYFDGSYNTIDTKFGIYDVGLLKNSVISNNNFWYQKSGAIHLKKANSVVISNNNFEENDFYLTGHADIEIVGESECYNNIISNNTFFRNKYYNSSNNKREDRPTTNQIPVMKINNTAGYPLTIVHSNAAVFLQFFSNIQCSGSVICKNNSGNIFFYKYNPGVEEFKNDKEIYYSSNDNILLNKLYSYAENKNIRIDNVKSILNDSLSSNFDYNYKSTEEYNVFVNNMTKVNNKPDFASVNEFVIYKPIVSNTYGIQIVFTTTGNMKYRFLQNGTWGQWN